MSSTSLWNYVPPKLRQLFVGGSELTFDSELSSNDLIERFRETLQSGLDLPTGTCGYARGSSIHIRWATGIWSDGFAPVFHGRVTTTPTGSRLVGRISSARSTQIITGLWCGAVLLISIVFIWTIFMPIAGFCLIWFANGVASMGDLVHPDRQEKIVAYINQTCLRHTT